MNEFIVWDNSDYKKKFIDIKNQQIVLNLTNGGLKGLYGGDGYMKDWQLFQSIGIKDINEKSIYADSSIVEFQWVNGFGNIQTDWGVFKYDIDYLQFLIYEENEDINKSSIKDVLNIKIIDTIQENKLGLIKWI